MKKKLLLKDKIFKGNPKIDRKLVDKAENLEKQLQALGVSTKSRYTLSHPLNSSATFLFNQ